MSIIIVNILIGLFVIIIATFPFSMAMIMEFGVKILDKILDKLWKN